LLNYYYGLKAEDVNALTIRQYHSRLSDIPRVHAFFQGTGQKASTSGSEEELARLIERRGLTKPGAK